MMVLPIAEYELRYRLQAPQTLLIALVLFGAAFVFTANGVEFQATMRGGNVFINAPYIIVVFLCMLSLPAVFLVPSFMASAVVKDVECRFDGILFATPITCKAYFWGRFVGAFTALVLIFAAAPLGLYVGTLWPWAVAETLGPNNLSHYFFAFGGFLVPVLFSLSSFVFAVAAVTRSMIYSYLASLGVLLLYLTVAGAKSLPELWDPLMVEVVAQQTRYWTAADCNRQLLSFSGLVLSNRVLWTALACAALGIAYFRFSFRVPLQRSKEKTDRSIPEVVDRVGLDTISHVVPRWDKPTTLKQLAWCTRFEVLALVKSRPFLLLMGFCLFLLFFALTGRETLYDVKTYPLTRILLGAIQSSLTMALMAVLAFFSADVIWREKACHFSEIIDALPVPNWVFAVSKIAALFLVMEAIVLIGVVLAVLLQVAEGYHEFQWDRYLGRGLIYYPMPYLFLAVLTCFFQVLTRNRLLGILCFVGFTGLLAVSHDVFGVEHILLSYGLPGIDAPLSDMNYASRFAVVGYWARAYWGAMAGLLLLLTYALWCRGTLQPLRLRLRGLRLFKARKYALLAGLFGVIFLVTGSVIYFNTNVRNIYRSERDIEALRFAYERQYRQYAHLPMPRIVEVAMEVDLFPNRRRVEARGSHVLQNKTGQDIRTVHLIFPIEAEIAFVALEGAVQQSVDEPLAYYIFHLEKPMTPGEKRTLRFETVLQQRGFPNSRPDTRLVRNGTFISNHQLTPYVGFYSGLMIGDRHTRRKYGLDPLPRLPKLEDVASRNNNYLRQDSDFINFEATVSTVIEQKAVAPGYLERSWTEGDRRYFSYKMEVPMMNFYGFLSAEYEVKRDAWHGVDIEVFHHRSHAVNVDRMIAGVKDGLAYYSQAFAPYPYRQVRILEFPAYREFAQAFPNTIPFSEGIGFVADVTDPNETDLPYYVTAHELAHQWWAHQVMSANVQGGTMLVETLAQYSALMVMEKRYGKHRLRKFLKLELDRYLRGRTNDPDGEMPLFRVENQSYIHYRKGAVVMFALKEYLGEDVVNRALRRLVTNHAFKSQPYAVSTDLITYMKEETEPSQHSLIEDFLEKITLFDLKLDKATAVKRQDGRFKVLLEVSAAKFYADGEGHEREVPLDIPVEIGIFTGSPAESGFDEGQVILLGRQALKSGHAVLEFVVDHKPQYAGIDPYHKLIDRESADNLRAVGVGLEP